MVWGPVGERQPVVAEEARRRCDGIMIPIRAWPMAELIRQSLWFPVIQSVHIVGLTTLVGTISLVDLCVLGVAFRARAPREVATAVAVWTWLGLGTVVVTGALLFGADLERYVQNVAFLWKMALLALALGVHFTLHRWTAGPDSPERRVGGKLAAALSLLAWCGVVVAGRAIADFDA